MPSRALRGRVREHAGAAQAARRVGRERDNVGRGGPALRGDREQQERLPGARPRHVALRIPKPRTGSFFPDNVIERYQRVNRAAVAAVSEMCATGTSARKVQGVAAAMGTELLSKDRVSAMCEHLDLEVEELVTRPLGLALEAPACQQRAGEGEQGDKPQVARGAGLPVGRLPREAGGVSAGRL